MWSPENPTGNICIKQRANQSLLKFVQATTNSSPCCCQRQSKENVTDCASTHVKPNHTTATQRKEADGEAKKKKKSILCTPYNSGFLPLKEHPIHIPPLSISSIVHSGKSLPSLSGSDSAYKDFPEWRGFPRGSAPDRAEQEKRKKSFIFLIF